MTAGPYSGTRLEAWAVQEKLAVITDRWFVPLAVAEPKVLLELMGKQKQVSQHQTGLLPVLTSADSLNADGNPM